jgi:ABC-type sugar transport system permease subunit
MYRNIFSYSKLGYGSSIAVVIVASGLLFSVLFKRYLSIGELQY